MTDRQTNRQTDGHGDSKTNSAKRAELVKITMGKVDMKGFSVSYLGFLVHVFIMRGKSGILGVFYTFFGKCQ